MTNETVPAISRTMAGHTSDPDLAFDQDSVFAASEIDVCWENWTSRTQELPSSNLQDEFTPAIALEYGLNLDFLVGRPNFNEDPELVDWDSYKPPVSDDNAPKGFPGLNDFGDEYPEDKPFGPEVREPATQPKNDPLSRLPYSSKYGPTSSAIQDSSPVCEVFTNPSKLSLNAVNDCPNISECSDSLGSDLNGFLPEDFELPDIPPGLDSLQNLYPISKKSQSAITADRVAGDGPFNASRVALAASSEPNPKNEGYAGLTNPHRPLYGRREHPSQRRPEFRIRVHRNKRYSKNSAYTPLNEAPKPWDIFKYTKDGELDPSRLFSAEEISRFLFTHPLHQGHRNLKNSPLKLRVHRTPASSAKRFPNGLFCRFKDCPMGTIGQGQKLVVVDELSVHHPDHDLFLNAFYVHLWCFEKFCNFPEICAHFDVTAKGREARKEQRKANRFLLSCEEARVVEDFVARCATDGRGAWVAHCPNQRTIGCSHYEPQSPPYKGTLCHQLNVTKLHYGGQGRINLRKDREEKAGYQGANITRHLGDLSKEVQLREFSRTHKNQNQLKQNPRTERRYRTNGDDSKGGEQSDDGDCAINRRQGGQNEFKNDQNFDHDMVQPHDKPRHRRFKIPVWNQSNKDELEDTPGISPRTVFSPATQQTHSQLQMTAASLGSAPISGLKSMTSEDDSEGEIELALIAAQRERRMLEIEDAKDKERECKLRKLKLHKANEKRAREEGDDADGYGAHSKSKRQRER